MALLILLSSIPSFAETAKESPLQIWKVGDRRWTVEEEVRYGQWVEKNITEDFFIHHKIPVDCADVPYAVRWIYARIAHLPAAATTKHDKLIGHWSTEWGRLPTHSEWHKDQRFRKALFHMLSETTTDGFFHHGISLWRDWTINLGWKQRSSPSDMGGHRPCKNSEVEPEKFSFHETRIDHLLRSG